MFGLLVSSLRTICLALLLLATPTISDPCTFNDVAACNTQDICTPIEYTECLIAHNSITASIACIGEANTLLTSWWSEPANPNTCDNKNPDADDDTNDVDNFVVSFGQEFAKAAQSPSCNCSPGGAINDCHLDWTDDTAFAKCLCQDGVSNDDLRCLHSCLKATGLEYCLSDFCNSASAKAGTLFDQAVLGSCKNPTNEAASGGDSSGGDSSGAAATPDAPAAAKSAAAKSATAKSAAASSSVVSSTVSPSSTAATASQAVSPSSTLPSPSTSATTSPTKSGSGARRIKASGLGYLFLIIYIVR